MIRLSGIACWALDLGQKSCHTIFVCRWRPFAWASEALLDSHTFALANADGLAFRRLAGDNKADPCVAHLLGRMADGLVRQEQRQLAAEACARDGAGMIHVDGRIAHLLCFYE